LLLIIFLFLLIGYIRMDNIEEPKEGFFKHVFNFEDDSKAEILNIIQYALLAIIPIVILNKMMQQYVPEADDNKNSLELTAEIIIQVIVMFIGILVIHRIITYIPTYSKVGYPQFHVTFIILAVLMITLSLQTKLGEKVSILVDRLFELWEGKQNNKNGKGNKNQNVKVSQPISGNQVNTSVTAMTQSLYNDGTAINSLPQMNNAPTQQLPNYNDMYRQDNTPLVNAATPGQTQQESFDILPANSVLGGSFGSAW